MLSYRCNKPIRVCVNFLLKIENDHIEKFGLRRLVLARVSIPHRSFLGILCRDNFIFSEKKRKEKYWHFGWVLQENEFSIQQCDSPRRRTQPDLEAEPDPGRDPFFESNSFFFCQ